MIIENLSFVISILNRDDQPQSSTKSADKRRSIFGGYQLEQRRTAATQIEGASSSTRQSNGLLIRRFGVRFPGGPPILELNPLHDWLDA